MNHTDQELNIAVAKALGWRHCPAPAGSITTAEWQRPDGSYTDRLPDYGTDLNAIHEAELILSALDHQKFCLFLHKSIMGTMDNFDVNGTCNLECISRVVKATAAQRREAFLRAHNLYPPTTEAK